MATIAQIIREHRDAIMDRWRDESRVAASARGLSSVALENMMPTYLSALGDPVHGGDLAASQQRRQHLEHHLSTRLRQGFDLAEIVEEFVRLGRCVAAQWKLLPERERPSVDEIERFHTQIHGAVIDVTDAFRHHMMEDEQSEKRFSRRLQEIASAALHAGKPLHDRLRELLEVVMEAMGAQCAAFFVHDLTDDKLVLEACAGLQAAESYKTSISPMSFVGEVAMHDEPTQVADARTTRLEVPDALRQSGIHSLLGVRLPQANPLLGVMYIGFSNRRDLTSREMRRIESLGERISLHLENARLFSELRDRIEALAMEKALREQFVSILAHDLRGPLSAAGLAAELLALQPENLDRRRELAIKIDRNIARVDRMIHDLLDANRIRGGEPLPLRLDRCDLGALASQVVEEARAMHGDRFHLELEGPVRGLWSEEDLHRALWNLVTNAVKYGAPEGPVSIAVGTRDGVARVSVHNVGAPIPESEQARIFDAYARAPAADAGGRKGWGLGLTLVRGTAEAHGGHVSVTSDAGSGTTFTIELPLEKAAVRSCMTGLRALVADDDPEMLALVASALRHLGGDVVAVGSGGELLESLANAGAFDVIVTDISMPWMTGLQVMHSARTAGLAIPVVVMTGMRDPSLPEQVMALGACAELLHKPFTTDELQAAICRALEACAVAPKERPAASNS